MIKQIARTTFHNIYLNYFCTPYYSLLLISLFVIIIISLFFVNKKSNSKKLTLTHTQNRFFFSYLALKFSLFLVHFVTQYCNFLSIVPYGWRCKVNTFILFTRAIVSAFFPSLLWLCVFLYLFSGIHF